MTTRNERLRGAYAAAGFSQTAFAAACGVSQPAMSGFANYTTAPSPNTVRSMLEVLLVANRAQCGSATPSPDSVGYLIVSVDGEERVVDLPTAKAVAARYVEVAA